MDTVVKKAEQTIEKYKMIETGQRVLAGFSGGGDSTAMLLMLSELREKINFGLIGVHLNHQLRGRESDNDENYVRHLAKRFHIPLYCGQADVAALARENKLSLEDAAREARYDFFLKTARQLKAQKIAVAHTADDQAETVLMRIIYGSGLRGFAGIKPVRNIKPGENIKVIRPLIEISREELSSFLREKRYRPRIDSSNLNLNMVRNRVRYDLLPRLEKKYNIGIKNVLCRLSQQLSGGYDYLRAAARQHLKKAVLKKSPEVYILDVDYISGLHTALRSEMIRLVIEECKGDLKGIVYQNLVDVEKLLTRKGGWACLHLPGGIKISREYNQLSFFKSEVQPDKVCSEDKARRIISKLPVMIKLPGTTKIKELGIKVRACLIKNNKAERIKGLVDNRKNIAGHKKHNRLISVLGACFSGCFEEYFDFDKLKGPFKIRLRQPADRIRPLGLKKTKKIKDIFIDQKIPARLRPVIPLLLSGNEIAWICGICISDLFKIDCRTTKILKIKILKITCQKM